MQRVVAITLIAVLLLITLTSCCGTPTSKTRPVSYTRTCSVCGAPAVFYCKVRHAWFCSDHAGRSSSGGYICW